MVAAVEAGAMLDDAHEDDEDVLHPVRRRPPDGRA
jgi:hypothetical protein